VIVNSFFDGVAGFPLGRNHLDGQFYLVNCRFSANMADRPFTRPPSSPREWQWGARHYYANCHRDGGDYAWFRDNLNEAEGSPSPDVITARWAFDGRWDPESAMRPVLPFASRPRPGRGSPAVHPDSVLLSWLPGRTAVSHQVSIGMGDTLQPAATVTAPEFRPGPLRAGVMYRWRVDAVTETGIVRGETWSFSTSARSTDNQGQHR
jgi:hypothetical protein